MLVYHRVTWNLKITQFSKENHLPSTCSSSLEDVSDQLSVVYRILVKPTPTSWFHGSSFLCTQNLFYVLKTLDIDIDIDMGIDIDMYTYVYVYAYICMCIYIYIYICMYTFLISPPISSISPSPNLEEDVDGNDTAFRSIAICIDLATGHTASVVSSDDY